MQTDKRRQKQYLLAVIVVIVVIFAWTVINVMQNQTNTTNVRCT